MTPMPFHPTVFAAFRLGAKTYLRKEPVANPVAHAVGGFTLLAAVAIVGLIASHQYNRAAAQKADALMATFAVPSALYGAELRSAELVEAEESAALEREVSAR